MLDDYVRANDQPCDQHAQTCARAREREPLLRVGTPARGGSERSARGARDTAILVLAKSPVVTRSQTGAKAKTA